LARMNMILHNNPTAETKQGNTLANPLFKNDKGDLKTFDYVVANPPFSDKRWSTGLSIDQDPFDRFVYGTPPGKQGDYAYLLHIVRSLKSTGKGACILPHGVLFRGNAEAEIRRNLIQRGYIQGIIGLPANLFYGTGIPACIVVIDKQNAANRQGIFMIDASAGYMKDGNKNRLRDMDIHRIVDVFTKQLEVPKFSRLVPVVEIERNEFNLNIPRYIDSQQAEDVQDIRGHLQGGIPVADVEALGRYWSVCPNLKESLFQRSSMGSSLRLRSGNSLDRALSEAEGDDRYEYLDLAVPKDGIKSAIFTHPEFIAFSTEMAALFDDWRQRSAMMLKDLTIGSQPKVVITKLAEDLLEHYAGKDLVDRYDIYQHLMDYWTAVMQDDCYLVAADGWQAETYRVIEVNKKGKETDKGWACDLVPKDLLVARYFGAEQEAIDLQQAELEAVAAQMEELEEEHGGDEGLFGELEKVNKATVTARLKEIKGDQEALEEAKVLKAWLGLSDRSAALKKEIKEAEVALDLSVYNKYPVLSEDEIKGLVVDDKWLAKIGSAIAGEIDRVSMGLTQRVKVLAERYEVPLPAMVSQVAELEARVAAHLAKMGFES
jgi:type I restriction enzyme M protein